MVSVVRKIQFDPKLHTNLMGETRSDTNQVGKVIANHNRAPLTLKRRHSAWALRIQMKWNSPRDPSPQVDQRERLIEFAASELWQQYLADETSFYQFNWRTTSNTQSVTFTANSGTGGPRRAARFQADSKVLPVAGVTGLKLRLA
jgi:hypothetical protein